MNLDKIEEMARLNNQVTPAEVLMMVDMIRKQEKALNDSNNSLMAARVLKEFYECAEPDAAQAVPVQAGMPAVTVDTPEFHKLTDDWRKAPLTSKAICDAWEAITTYITAHTAQERKNGYVDGYAKATVEHNQRQACIPEPAAAPQQHAQAAQPNKQYGLAAYAQANADSIMNGNAQAALSEATIDEVIAAMGWSLDDVERNDVGQFAHAVLKASQQPAAAQHPDDIAWDKFAAAGKAEMAKKRNEGRGGWDDPKQCLVQDLATLLVEQVEMGNPIHIGNFSMMIWNRMQSGYTLGDLDIITAGINHRSAAAPAIQQEGAALDIEPL